MAPPSYRRLILEYDMAGIETRVARIAEALLAERQFIAPVDVLIGLGWLAHSNVDRCRSRGGAPT